MDKDEIFWLRFDHDSGRLIHTPPLDWYAPRPTQDFHAQMRVFRFRKETVFRIPGKVRRAMKLRPYQKIWMGPMGNELVIIANPRRYRFKLRLRRAQATSGRRQALKPPASSPLISVLVGQ